MPLGSEAFHEVQILRWHFGAFIETLIESSLESFPIDIELNVI